MNWKGLLKSWRIWFLVFWLIVAAVSINYQFNSDGAAISSIETNSSAAIAGMVNPGSSIQPTSREVITAVNDRPIKNAIDFYKEIEKVENGGIIKIKTSEGLYSLLSEENKSIGITVGDAPSSNLRKGLDLQGGTRVVLKPVGEVTDSEIKDVMDTISNRLNVYGLADVTVRSASDLGGAKYIVVEIAGATKQDVKDLISKQGNFEAKIGENITFKGGQEDITFVCRTDGTCSRIAQCGVASEGYACRFEFEIKLSEEAASRQAEITKDLKVNTSQTGNILEKQLDFYLDGKPVDHLNIAADLKGQKATSILITGPGVGKTKQDAINDAIANRDKLQTLLITGSLPTNLEIVKLDTISPSLGQQFINNTFLVALVAILAVTAVIFIRYRVWKVTFSVIITMLSEVFIVLGLAALFKYNLDLAAIAGIIASVGTGVDDQVVITDELVSKEQQQSGGTLERIKKAFFVIMIAYAATVAAMLPLLWAGVGLLKGFALVTIAGVTVGVFITRPAFGVILKHLIEK